MSFFSDTRFPTARKEHRCDWCNETILPGHTYATWCGVFEGDFFQSKLHMECHAAMKDAPREDLEDGWEIGTFKRGTAIDKYEYVRMQAEAK